MHKKLLAVAVAGALVAPSAFAQTAVPPNIDTGYRKPPMSMFGLRITPFGKKLLAKIGHAWTRFKSASSGAGVAIAAKIRAMKTSARNAAARHVTGYKRLFAPAAGAF